MNKKNTGSKPLAFERAPECVTTLGEEYKAGHKGGGTRRKKSFKVFGVTGLALVMGAGVLFGTVFAPVGATSTSISGNLAAAAQSADSAQGLITPHEDDPVLFTTESGLEIKWGNVKTNTTLASGALAGYPYFKTAEGSKSYTWVIIGRNPSLSTATLKWNEAIYSTWITNTGHATVNEFITNQKDVVSPAGQAIENDIQNDYLFYEDHLSFSLSNVTSNSEIPEGSVLCLANDIIESANYTTIYTAKDVSYSNGAEIILKMPRLNYSYLGGVLEAYYTNNRFGLNHIKHDIQSVTLYSKGYTFSSVSTGTVGGYSCTIDTCAESSTSSAYHIFALSTGATTTYGTEQFNWATYLTNDTAKGCSSDWWLRTPNSVTGGATRINSNWPYTFSKVSTANCIDTEGLLVSCSINTVVKSTSNTLDSRGVRPAFCLKLI